MKQKHNGSIKIDPIGDTMWLSYIVDSGRVDSHKLDALALRELKYNTIKNVIISFIAVRIEFKYISIK